MNKPPAFQFYVKDWRSSPTVQSMNHRDRGIYIDLLALAWDSEEPGKIKGDIKQIAQLIGVNSPTLRRFFDNFPSTFRQLSDGFYQVRLCDQYAKCKEISEKRKLAASKCSAIAKQMGGSAFAFASANLTTKTPLPPASGGQHSLFLWGGETISVEMGRRRRLPNLECMIGGRADEVVDYLNRKGFPARIGQGAA